MEQHFMKSSFREKLIEHLFIGELLKISWASGLCDLEVARPEVDAQGYDLIAESNGFIRHIQLKAAKLSATTSTQMIHIALSKKPSGCVIWIYFDETTLELGPFLYFGSEAGKPLPDVSGFKVGKHVKANAEGIRTERPEMRVVNKGCFTRYDQLANLYRTLFGG